MQAPLPLDTQSRDFEFPAVFTVREKIAGNSIIQLIRPAQTREVTVQEYNSKGVEGFLLSSADEREQPVLAIANSAKPPKEFKYCLKVERNEDFVLQSKSQWIKHPQMRKTRGDIDYAKKQSESLASWKNRFSFLEEDPESGSAGLRIPQVGAIHAVHSHWAVTADAATVVMPTGTGKTEVMLSLLVSRQCHRLLVIVPTDALRTQIADKFSTLGVLKEYGVVSDSVELPIVGVLNHRPSDPEAVERFFEKCNVVVTTMAVAGGCSEDVQRRMASLCKYLFIDEAHHIPAKSWNSFKNLFSESKILQFTATPFREDGKSIGGEVIFNYPLKKAQEEGYFRKINFRPITEYDPRKRDEAIATAAIAQLRTDLDKGHILMARVATRERAEQVFEIYRRHPEFNPVILHSSLPTAQRKINRGKILSGEARIVVCINMLGEGFDLPELKIAAFHDIRKSLAVTLQLAGRFTRARSDLGDPTFVANLADVDVNEELRMLYVQDPDWNELLPEASKAAIEKETNLWDFLKGFEKFPEDISLLNFRPAMSAVAYKTKRQQWSPENYIEGLRAISSYDKIYHDVNNQTNTLVVVTSKKVPVDWAHMDEVYTWEWELYIAFWDQSQNLLFIHSSTNRGYFAEFAKAIAGDDVEMIKGASIFRCFSGVNRLRLQNVGLLIPLGRLIRYEMRAGSDVEPALTEAERRRATKSNIFGAGFEHGQKTTIGCSYKGRLWSRRTTNLRALTEWCSGVGRKLIDESIDPDEVLRGTLVPEEISERPDVMPIGIEWPEIMYIETEAAFYFTIGETHIPLHETDINLVNPSETGELTFEVRANDVAATFVLNLTKDGELNNFTISQPDGEKVQVNQRSKNATLADFFNENPPTIWFANGSSLEGNILVKLKQDYPPYSIEKISAWDWNGINIRKESQGREKAADSIQNRVIQEIIKQKPTIIFDDDDTGEAADVVAIYEQPELLTVELYHCKYSLDDTPGQRINDLYEVCGQAQKCIHWADRPVDFFSHLIRREPRRTGGTETTRFELGSQNDLVRLHAMSRRVKVDFKIYIVQPGLSKQNASNPQLALLSVTENYLMGTYMIPFGVISSS